MKPEKWSCQKCTDQNLRIKNEPQSQLNQMCFLLLESHLSRSDIERAVSAAMANVDSVYEYSRREWVYKPAELLYTFFSNWKKEYNKSL